MNTANWMILRAAALGLAAIFGQTACAQSPDPAATAPATVATPPASQSGAAPAVTGLPDFTVLVEQNAPAVVNIRATILASSRRSAGPQGPQQEIPEFFRRFFGPEFEMPPGGGRDRESGGSGFIISPDGYILTNNHVVRGADEVRVTMTDRSELIAEVIGTDPQTDIAVLKIDGENLPTARMGQSSQLKPGQWVIAIGSPFSFDHSVTAGVVSATGRSVGGQSQQYVPFIQTDVAINPGNSGGPLFNLNGEVVGINSQIFSGTGGYMGISFAIPIEVAQNVVEQLKNDGRVRRGLVGVRVQPVTREFAESLGLDRPAGALVAEVSEDGAAGKAGVQVGDVILSFNDRPVETSNDLPPIVGLSRPGDKVPMEIWREGRRRTLTVTVGEAEQDPEAIAAGSSPDTPATGANQLGLAVQELTAEQRERLGLEAGQGVVIARATGPAARAGLARGDVVLRVGRTDIDGVRAFERAVRDVGAGDSVMLLARRDQSNAFYTITIRDSDR